MKRLIFTVLALFSAVAHSLTLNVSGDTSSALNASGDVDDASLTVRGRSTASNATGSYLSFSLANVPSSLEGQDIEKAVLRLWLEEVSRAGSLSLEVIESDWSESDAEYGSLPITSYSKKIRIKKSQKKNFIYVDLTELVRIWIDSPASNFGVALLPDKSRFSGTFSSKESSFGQSAQIEVALSATRGPRGLKGAKGAKGARGAKGAKGARGARGLRGATGAQGEQGLQGEQGEKGDTGDTGDTGATGAQGEQGPQGEQGEKGDKGDTGDAGATGAQGEQGEKGEDGRDAFQGVWDSSQTYSIGEFVIYRGRPYWSLSNDNYGTSPGSESLDCDFWSSSTPVNWIGVDGYSSLSCSMTGGISDTDFYGGGSAYYFIPNATAENYESALSVASAALTIEHPLTITGLELGGRVMADSYNSQKDYSITLLVDGVEAASISGSIPYGPYLGLSEDLNLEVDSGSTIAIGLTLGSARFLDDRSESEGSINWSVNYSNQSSSSVECDDEHGDESDESDEDDC